MTLITIPVDEAKSGGTLYTLVDDLTNLNSEVSNTRDESGDNLIIDDTDASSEQKLEIDEANILAILTAGGEIEDYLFGIRAPIASANIDVPDGVPHRLFKLEDIKKFHQWFSPASEIWKNTGLGEIIYYNNPMPEGLPNLKASESEIIRQIDPNADDVNPVNRTYFFLTVAEVQEEVALSGWVKL